ICTESAADAVDVHAECPYRLLEWLERTPEDATQACECLVARHSIVHTIHLLGDGVEAAADAIEFRSPIVHAPGGRETALLTLEQTPLTVDFACGDQLHDRRREILDLEPLLDAHGDAHQRIVRLCP